jgi:PAS domain S-box-containing protein
MLKARPPSNPAAKRMLGWAAEELVGKAIHPIVHHSHHDGSHYPDEDCPIYAAFRDGAVHNVGGEVFWRKDGSPVWVEYTSTPIRDRGTVVGAVIVFRDVSQRREPMKLHAALAEVDRLRERQTGKRLSAGRNRIETNPRGSSARARRSEDAAPGQAGGPTTAAVMITGSPAPARVDRARHSRGLGRRDQPLIRVNCAAFRANCSSNFRSRQKAPAVQCAPHRPLRRRRHAVSRRGRGNSAGVAGRLLRVLQGNFERSAKRTRAVDVR